MCHGIHINFVDYRTIERNTYSYIERPEGRILVAELAPLEFLVTGFEASVIFDLSAESLKQSPNQQLEILTAEEGHYVDGVWQSTRILNGDETDRGLQFHGPTPPLVRIRLHTLPLYGRNSRH